MELSLGIANLLSKSTGENPKENFDRNIPESLNIRNKSP
jgi:hypothetical protein